jgi:hypothetical protein
VWTPDGAGIVAVAWPHKALNFPNTSRRLGIVHCFNRPCGLHYIPYQAPPSSAASTAGAAAAASGNEQQAAAAAAAAAAVATVPLTGSLMSGLSPVFTPDGSQLLFILQEAAAASGVHAATSALYSLEWSGQVRVRCLHWAVGCSAPCCLLYVGRVPCNRLLSLWPKPCTYEGVGAAIKSQQKAHPPCAYLLAFACICSVLGMTPSAHHIHLLQPAPTTQCCHCSVHTAPGLSCTTCPQQPTCTACCFCTRNAPAAHCLPEAVLLHPYYPQA